MLEQTTAELAAWRPGMEGMLDDVWLQVQKFTNPRDRNVFDAMSHHPGILSSPTPAGTFPVLNTTSPDGHRAATTTRDVESGVVMTWAHVPAMGTSSTLPLLFDPPLVVPPKPPPFNFPPPPRPPFPPPPPRPPVPQPQPVRPILATNATNPQATGRLPKLTFHRFDGENLRL